MALRRAGYWLARARMVPPAALDEVVADAFDGRERAEYDRLSLLARRDRVVGRIAAKAAVRHWLAGAVPLRAIRIANDPDGRPRARSRREPQRPTSPWPTTARWGWRPRPAAPPASTSRPSPTGAPPSPGWR